MGKVATSPLPSQGSPPLQSGGKNQKWPTSGQSGYVTPAVSGIPTASERGAKSQVAHLWAKWLCHPCCLGDPHRFRAGGIIRNGPLVGKVATSTLPSHGSPPLQSGGAKIKSGPQVGNVATSPLPARGSPPLRSGGQNQKWPTCGQSGYVTAACSGIPTSAERGGGGIRSGPLVGKVATSPLPSRGSPPLQSGGAKSEMAHLWAKWLRHPCRLGDPHRFRAGGGGIRSGPQVDKVATSPLTSRGSPPLQSGGGGGGLEVAHLWAKWLRHPCRLGDPHRFRAGGKSEVVHLWAKWLRHPCRLGDPHRCRAGGGGASEVAHLLAKWLRHPCRLGDPHRCRAGGGN